MTIVMRLGGGGWLLLLLSAGAALAEDRRLRDNETAITTGVPSPNVTENVEYIGGREQSQLSSLGEHRYHVALLSEAKEKPSEWLQGCLAFAIAPSFFITRASCVMGNTVPPSLYVETAEHHYEQFDIQETKTHPDMEVNLAIFQVVGSVLTTIKPTNLIEMDPAYYDAEPSLVYRSLDMLFNPSAFSDRPQEVFGLARVPVDSCQFGADPDTVHCYAPSDVMSRQTAFSFDQGFLTWDDDGLVGLPDCAGLCGGGMFYSTTHLASFKPWINDVTGSTARWVAPDSTKIAKARLPDAGVSLASLSFGDSEALCEGTLIAPRFIVTSASCVNNGTVDTATIGIGEYQKETEDKVPVERVYIHPWFGKGTEYSNDIAVIELKGPSLYSPMMLVSNDTLLPESCELAKPFSVSSVDGSLLCLHQASSSNATRSCHTQVRHRTSKKQGDGVFMAEGQSGLALVGISLGFEEETPDEMLINYVCDGFESKGGQNLTASTFIVRLATPETIEFIDSVSMDHTWSHRGRQPVGPLSIFQLGSHAKRKPAPYTGELEFEDAPVSAALGFVVGLRTERYGQNFCGGSLIASSYVLTAAHCVQAGSVKFVSVGSHDSAGKETEAIAVKSTNIITHPLYNQRSSFSYDVAILELETQAYPKPITLDNTLELDPTMYFTLYGYGANSASNRKLSNTLRSVDLPYFPRKKCRTSFPELDESMFCAGGELARDACTGDSGSPLIRMVNGQPVLVGVVSSGRNGCGTPGVPGVYALVAATQRFIDHCVAGHKWLDPATTGSQFDHMGPDGELELGSASKTQANSNTVMRSYQDENASLPFEIINMANGSFQRQLSIVELARDTPQRLVGAVLDFIIGHMPRVATWGVWTRDNLRLTFYSTGNLTGIMQTIARRGKQPLYTRQNRFNRPKPSFLGMNDQTIEFTAVANATCS
ncbi:hypothetical protein Poli38472_008735 [Pythium oligandrum]|uniref:Peptidase S1 domain-containing protein n=1 Tax=Pythium oligandrum TaxID=41045 RepID=A0A8K1FDZ1_PYTOL|nr:hypothetical protein Poli38472_008735 [Pythium oligandrum]|eukprot:TMW56087.1 hypothetical protein Poli38472_008735 [Pythium oligandrum]